MAPTARERSRHLSTYQEPYSARSGSRPPGGIVDARKLWTGGVITAVIVFGLTIAGFLIVRGILNYPILGIQRGGAVVHASMFGYAGGAALVALLATAAMHILLLSAPRPRWFFGWIGGVGTAIAVLFPLALPQDMTARLATATINLVLGLAITALVSGTAASLRPDGSPEMR
jgi:nitric oxide reductase large subunit